MKYVIISALVGLLVTITAMMLKYHDLLNEQLIALIGMGMAAILALIISIFSQPQNSDSHTKEDNNGDSAT